MQRKGLIPLIGWTVVLVVLVVIVLVQDKTTWQVFLWRVFLWETFALSSMAVVYLLHHARSLDQTIITMQEEFDGKLRELRRRKLEYEQHRLKYLTEKGKLSGLRRKQVDSEFKIDLKLEKRITDQEKVLTDALKAKKNFEKNEIEPIKEGVATKEGVEGKSGLRQLKSTLHKKETELVRRYYMYIALLAVLAGVTAMFLLSTYLVDGNKILDPQPVDSPSWFSTGSWAVLAFVLTSIVCFVVLSIKRVGKTERGVKFFWDKPYQEVTRGPHFVPWPVASLTRLPTVVQYYDMKADKVMLGGPESQEVSIDASIPYHYERPWDVVTELGQTIGQIEDLLKGDEKERMGGDKEKVRKGYIGDKITAHIRAYTASAMVPTLDDALQMRDELAEDLQVILKEDLEYLGLRFQPVIITDVKPSDEMIKERDKRAIAKVNIHTAEHQAAAVVKAADGERQRLGKIGQGEAAAIEAKGKVAGVAILAELKAKIDAIELVEKREAAKAALPFIATLLVAEKPVAELAKVLPEMKLNILAVPGIDQIFKSLGLSFEKLTGGGRS